VPFVCINYADSHTRTSIIPGQIIQRSEARWLVRVSLGRDPSGKRLFHSHTVRGTKADARRYLTKIQRELDTRSFVEPSRRPVGEYLQEWLESAVRPRVRPNTLADYSGLIARYINPAIGARRLGDLSALEIQRLYTGMQQRTLSARTIRYTHSVLHGALDQAVKWRMLARNPAKLVNLPRLDRREMRSLTAEEAGSLLDASAKTPLHALWVLLLSTGIRPGEALGLKWSDIFGDRIRIQRALVRPARGNWQLAEPKTHRARRVVTLPPSSLRALQSYRATQLEDRLRAGPLWSDLDLIFTNQRGAPLDYRVVVRRHFKPLVAAAGLGKLRPYDLRHSCATLLLSAGENVKVVSERLGHASAALTLDVYSHVLPDMQQYAADRLESLLFPAVGGAMATKR
jgi:integrase